jgi:hypothetical protein
MKTVLITIASILVFVLVMAASTQQPTTVCVPAHPKATIVKSFRSLMCLEGDMRQWIEDRVKEGYVVKSVAMMDDETFSKGIVVMEKY